MKSTIIIPNYNGIQYLPDCFTSLFCCKPQDFKVMVVDNGSNDGSVEFIQREYPQVELVELKENTGFANAVNEGIRRTKTEYVILLNNDTTVDREFVQHLEHSLDHYANTFSVSAKMIMMKSPDQLDGAGDLYCALGWAFALGKEKSVEKTYQKESVIFSACGGAAIYRTAVLKQIGGFDRNHFAYLEDVDVGYRAKIYGYQNRYEPKAICFHAGSGASGSRYNEFKINLASRNSIYLIYKNMPLFQMILNLPFLAIGFLIKIGFFFIKGYGKTYIKGIVKGMELCCSRKGKENKVKFSVKHLPNYVRIQLELWWNMIRRIIG